MGVSVVRFMDCMLATNSNPPNFYIHALGYIYFDSITMLTASYNCPCPRIISLSDDVGFAILQDLKIMNHNPLNLLRQSISNILQRFVSETTKLNWK